MLLSEIQFSGGENVAITPLTLIIGPNNAGKSRTLRELLEKFVSPAAVSQHRAVAEIKISPPSTWEMLRDSFAATEGAPGHPEIFKQTLNHFLNGSINIGIGTADGYHSFTPAETYISNYGMASVAYLGTQQRLQLLGSAGMISPLPFGQATNIVQNLFQHPDLEKEINTEIYREFRTRLHVDWSSLLQLIVRIGDDIHEISKDPMVAAPIAVQYETLESQGDGLRSFAATIAAIIVARRPVTLIDEPETSLHPPQATALGRFFGRSFSGGRQLIAATHSADILRGALNAPAELTLIRMTRTGGVNHAISVSAQELRDIANDPLLNASNILDAVFFSGAVVTEADADRAFYEEISNKLAQPSSIRFTSVQGKHTLGRAITAFRRMGVPFVAIADIDALRENQPFETLLTAATDDVNLRQAAMDARNEFLTAIEQPTVDQKLASMKSVVAEMQAVITDESATTEKVRRLARLAPRVARESDAWKRLKEGGVERMSSSEKMAFEAVSATLVSIGIFLVPVGELEWWLTCVGIPGKSDKRAWITTALQQARALEPLDHGPWRFMQRVHGHLFSESATVGSTQ